METVQVDYSRKWYVMAAVAMGIFLATIDGSIVNVALPTLVRAFGTEFATVQWVVLAYLLTLTTLMVSVGRLADMIGKKSIYAAGFVVFTLGSLLCGLAPTIFLLIVFRMFQAIGASMILALGMAIVTEAFPASERGRALGISGAVVSVGIVVGPTLGGVLIDALSWHWIFFVNLPVGVVGTLMVLRLVPALPPEEGERFDFVGSIALFVSLVSLLLALTFGQNIGFGDARVLLLLAVWCIFMVGFVVTERRVGHPMIDMRLFRNSLFSINLLTGFMTFVAIAGTLILMPFYLENVLGYNTREVGLLLAIVPIALGVTAPISGTLSDKFGTRPITVIGLAMLLIGYYAVSTLGLNTSAAGYVLRFLPIGLGMGIFQSPNNSAIMGAAPRRHLGVISGLLAITRTLGQTTGIAVLGAIWASRVYASVGEILPGGATNAPAAAQVAGLQQTFHGLVVFIAAALALAVWAVVKEWRNRRISVASGLAPSPASTPGKPRPEE